jgi:endoglucanase
MGTGELRAILGVVCLASILSCTGESGPSPGIAPIKLNQVGFHPAAQKLAVVPAEGATRFEVTSAAGDEVLFAGDLGPAEHCPFSGEDVRIADFSTFRRPGHYKLVVPDAGESFLFEIEESAHRGLAAGALKAFYYARSGTFLEPRWAGPWARPAGHPDLEVRVHVSAASQKRPEGTTLASPGGWYDAGDYNKYTVNSSISTWTLLIAWEHYPDLFADLEVGIPESDNGIPDVVDEALWNLRWMLTMQDPDDGGVYHKLTTKRFEPFVMPHRAQAPRYVVQKSTAAALGLAATAAAAGRILARWPRHQELAERCLTAARTAWAWAHRHPDVLFDPPPDILTGDYAFPRDELVDEFFWAGVELFLATGEAGFLEGIDPTAVEGGVPSWDWVGPLGWVSLAHHGIVPPGFTEDLIEERIFAVANHLRKQAESSAYRVAMGAYPERFLVGQSGKDFSWGSNGVALNQGLMLLAAFRLTGDPGYVDAASSSLDYVLGRNATGYCFVTGFGSRSPMNPHHRPSATDGIVQPVPGLVVGGPHGGRQDPFFCRLRYPSKLPARAYLDAQCSYATNEIAINWNASLVYVAGALAARAEDRAFRPSMPEQSWVGPYAEADLQGSFEVR